MIRVLVIDDSRMTREMISDAIKREPDLEVAGVAADGIEGLQKVQTLKPDVVTLDVKMPKMDGIETLEAILKISPLPVIMFSALTQRAASLTLDALERGAMDYIGKPEGNKAALDKAHEELCRKIRCVAGTDVQRILRIRERREQKKKKTAVGIVGPQVVAPSALQQSCIAIGISTGGPPVLTDLFQSLEPPLPPIAVVQHMPAQFTKPFADRLDSASALTICEAKSGDVLRPDHVLISPGGKHLSFMRKGKDVIAIVRDGAPVSGHKPSVDVMMSSVSQLFKDRCLGVIMTGMGRDGADGCRAIRDCGGYVLGQDQQSSAVYGMNKVAFAEGNVDRQFKLDKLPFLIRKHVCMLGAKSPAGETKSSPATCI